MVMAPETGCRITVVIVNYRSAHLLEDCLRSLEREFAACPQLRVVVVENDSGDDSAAQLGRFLGAPLWSGRSTLVLLEANRGYGAGVNAAVRRALAAEPPADYILVLNPDTLVMPGALRTLAAFMDSHPEAGIAGPLLVDTEGVPSLSAHCFPSLLREFAGAARLPLGPLYSKIVGIRPGEAAPKPTGWVVGAAMMVRRGVFEAGVLFDEGYFLYFEEIDFCLAVHKAGWSCWYVPDAQVMHVGGGSGAPEGPVGRRPPCWFDSRRRFWRKNHGRVGHALADLAVVSGILLRRVRRLFPGADARENAPILRDLLLHRFSHRPRTPY
jgi:N-acetylglucosaminyl-diphospho-decaprenol L-rhamnosyltransferase